MILANRKKENNEKDERKKQMKNFRGAKYDIRKGTKKKLFKADDISVKGTAVKMALAMIEINASQIKYPL